MLFFTSTHFHTNFHQERTYTQQLSSINHLISTLPSLLSSSVHQLITYNHQNQRIIKYHHGFYVAPSTLFQFINCEDFKEYNSIQSWRTLNFLQNTMVKRLFWRNSNRDGHPKIFKVSQNVKDYRKIVRNATFYSLVLFWVFNATSHHYLSQWRNISYGNNV